MKTSKLIAFITCSLVGALPAHAHHSINTQFNQQELASSSGEVVAFNLVNPHSILRLKVIDEQGKEEVREIEIAGRQNLTHGSYTDDTFKPGERLTVSGNPPHLKSPYLFFRSATRPDGTQVLPPGAERNLKLEDERERQGVWAVLTQSLNLGFVAFATEMGVAIEGV